MISQLLRDKENYNKEEDVDYLQVFRVGHGIIKHTQEVPTTKNIIKIFPEFKYEKIFAVQQDEEDKNYWVIMFASEY